MTPSDASFTDTAVAGTAFTPMVVPRVGETPTDLRGAADRARTRGYADGFAEGRRAALDEALVQQAADDARMQQHRTAYLAQRGSALSAMQASAAALDQRMGELSMLAADRIEELALELATAILGVEVSDPARSAAHALRRALAEMPVERWTRVVFSPQDAAILREDEDAAAALHGVRFAESDSVDPGGAIVEVEDGAVDTRIVQALARAGAALSGGGGQSAEVLA
ncbi:FliH/SctL family protein [Microbacterium oxydans]|uniref:Flagellar assembly protein H n=1 Tax=Microbacterium oxydans TaxID=82380 RepID=A0A0F0L653_9MICO|nr:FliH/SctL family protein [Microbacterium oxydans]KJL27770.1 flagellar assembly protein H [Microbacterium oxydans]